MELPDRCAAATRVPAHPKGGKILVEQLSGRLYRLWGPPVLSEGFRITYSTHFALNVLSEHKGLALAPQRGRHSCSKAAPLGFGGPLAISCCSRQHWGAQEWSQALL